MTGFAARWYPNFVVRQEQVIIASVTPNLAYCYDSARAIRRILNQASRAFQRVSGSFED